MEVITPEDEQKYFKRSKTFEDERLERAETTNRRLWIANWLQMVLSVVLVIGIVVAVCARQVFPFLAVQYADGRLEVLDLLKDPRKTYEEAMQEFWVRNYVSNRENWNWSQAQGMYDTVQLLNAPAQQQIYQTESAPQNKLSKASTYGQRADVFVRENSPPVMVDYDSTSGRHIMTYRWTKVVMSKVDNSAPITTNMVSTVTFRYDGSPAKPEVRKVNPLGFQVLDYRRDIDQGGAVK